MPWKGILSDIASKEQNFASGPGERKNLTNVLKYIRSLELGYLRMFRYYSEENTRFSLLESSEYSEDMDLNIIGYENMLRYCSEITTS